MVIESIGEQWRRALDVKMGSDQIEAEEAKARLFALAKYNASQMRLGQEEIKIIDKVIEESKEFKKLLESERILRVFDSLSCVNSNSSLATAIDKILVLT